MKRHKLLSILCCAMLCLGLLSGAALAVAEPTEEFYVCDEAGVIDADTEEYIIEQNKTLLSATGGDDDGRRSRIHIMHTNDEHGTTVPGGL